MFISNIRNAEILSGGDSTLAFAMHQKQALKSCEKQKWYFHLDRVKTLALVLELISVIV